MSEAATARRERVLTRLATSAAPRAFRIAFDLLRDRAEAEDAVQEALARACEGCERLREADAIEAWFFRVLTNVCLRVLRRRRWQRWFGGRRGQPADVGDLDEYAGPSTLAASALLDSDTSDAAVPGAGRADDALLRRQEVAHMLDLLDGLPPQQRVALVLRYGHDRSIAEISAALDIKPATVKTHLVRGLKRLRRSMERLS